MCVNTCMVDSAVYMCIYYCKSLWIEVSATCPKCLLNDCDCFTACT